MEEIIVNLNSEQKKAVLQITGPVLILAGAGSGKTRVITSRIANLILNHNIDKICAVTFTNKAAQEMRERVSSMVSSLSFYTQIRTFHSLCLFILRNEVENLGFNSAFTIYDTDTQNSLIRQILKDFSLDPKEIKPAKISSQIQRIKDSGVKLEQYIKDLNDSYFAEQFYAICKEYEKRKSNNQALDFGDLLTKTIELFKNKPQILEKYQNYWQYLMIDEYQDTNQVQYEFISMLAKKHKNICVVGDDDQSIYSWRGAKISNILSFEKDYPNTCVIKLEENYRSTGNIIDLAAGIIQHNSKRKSKNIFTNNQKGKPVDLSRYEGELAEASSIIRQIKEVYREKKKYSGIAIFYRTNAQSRILEEVCRKSSIPYKIFGGFRFFDRAEIKDLIAYLNLIVNPNDDMSLLRVINTPARGIGEKTVEKLLLNAQANNESLFQILDHPSLDVKKSSKEKLQILYKNLSELIEKNQNGTLSPSQIAVEIIDKVNLHSAYEKEGSEELKSRIDNIRELIRSMEEYEVNYVDFSLENYLNEISLLTSEESLDELDDYISLMTVHNSKGLEFDTVFIVSLVEGTFPHSLSTTLEEIEEERRLFYVAVTRAKKNLFLSYIQYSYKYGSQEPKTISRFISENRQNLSQANVPMYERKKVSFVESSSFKTSDFNQKYKVGDLVEHKTYGNGKIMSLSGSGDNQKATIKFGSIQKNFFLTYTPLKKL